VPAAEATDLRAVTEACISLKIYACELLPGTELGSVAAARLSRPSKTDLKGL